MTLNRWGGQIIKGLRVGGEFPSLRQLQIEHRNIQLPLGADLRIQLPQRPSGGVPGLAMRGLPSSSRLALMLSNTDRAM